MKNHKVIGIIQARMGSTRLPGKTLMKLGEETVLGYELARVRRAKKLDHLVVATTTNEEDDVLEKFCQESKVDCFRGSAEDVLDRYYQCSLKYPDYGVIVRITGDCPFVDPAVIDQVINYFLAGDYDYVSNVLVETFPDGLDVEVFRREGLAEAASQAKLLSEREHVTLYLRNQTKFKKGNVPAEVNLAHIRLTVDEPADLEVVRFLAKSLPPDVGYQEIVACLAANPDILGKNANIVRNEGLAKSLRQDKPISQKAIFVLAGGFNRDEKGEWHSSTFGKQATVGMSGSYVRIQAAASLWRSAPDSVVVPSGGRGTADHLLPPNLYLSTIMRRELEALGVPANSIIEENQSGNTFSQLKALIDLVQKYGWDRVIIVSSRFHLPRVQTMIQYLEEMKALRSKVEYASAEKIVLAEAPEEWRAAIDEAYKSDEFKKLIELEMNGVEQIRSGKYQLAPKA